MTSWTLKIAKQAEEDLKWFRDKDKKVYEKCFDLTRAVLEEPYIGIGKPERLKGLGGNVWSRRVTLEHRMVYEVFVSARLIVVVAYRYHYVS